MLPGEQNDFTEVANLLSAKHANYFKIQFDFSSKYEPQPHFSVFNPTCVTHFTFSTKNDGKNEQFEATFKKGKQKVIVKFEKFKRTHKVTVTSDNKLRCEFCNYSISMGSPCRHIIACNQQKVEISDFHIKHCKSYNCGSMAGKVIRKFGDYSLPSFRGIYDPSKHLPSTTHEIQTENSHASSMGCDQIDCVVSQIRPETKSSTSKENYLKCVEARDNLWSVAGKNLSSAEKGAEFYLKLTKEFERKAISFIEENNSAPKTNLSQIEDTPFLKPAGCSNKRTKAHYESSSKSSKKQDGTALFELRIADSKSCKPKGRPSKKPKK